MKAKMMAVACDRLASEVSEMCGAEGMLTCAASVGIVSAMLRARHV